MSSMHIPDSDETWAVVLAAGEGRRLRSLTTTAAGETIPKQFCSINRTECLLELALQRATAVAKPEQICTIVASQHRRWWQQPLKRMASRNIFVQPADRGTAIGTALSLLHLESINPNATVVLLPADHSVRYEDILAKSLRHAARSAAMGPSTVYLLGAEPDCADTELGYIVPGPGDQSDGADVREFVEKPDDRLAQKLISSGALWNMFIVAGRVETLLNLLDKAFNFVSVMRSVMRGSGAGDVGTMARLYSELPFVDFSRDLLSHYPGYLKVQSVPPCGWKDLGTPKQVIATVEDALRCCGPGQRETSPAMYLDLASVAGA
ncbi:MAG: sugar phosphate nucleotidyltransferase [Pseudomonadota bacterium]|nr:sugar phosphate nucleotidyltransferase [Pseudomonadota bacterium]